MALRPEAEPDEQGGLGQVVADPVEVDAGDRGAAAPAGELAVGAVEQQVDLDEERGDDGRPQAAERDHDAGRAPRRRSSGQVSGLGDQPSRAKTQVA